MGLRMNYKHNSKICEQSRQTATMKIDSIIWRVIMKIINALSPVQCCAGNVALILELSETVHREGS